MKKYFFEMLFWVLLPIVKFYWFLFRPKTKGVKCIIKHKGQVLLIKNSYGSRLWTLPGGGVKKGEPLREAIIREVKEETGLIIKNPERLGSIFYDGEYKKNTIWVFLAEVFSPAFKNTSPEIDELGWFATSNLPKKKSHLLKKFLALAGDSN